MDTDWSSVVVNARRLSMYRSSPEYLSTSGLVIPVAVKALPAGTEKISPTAGILPIVGIANIPFDSEEIITNLALSEDLVIVVSSVNKLVLILPEINQHPEPVEPLKNLLLS